METLHGDLLVNHGKVSYVNFPVFETSSTSPAEIIRRINLCSAWMNSYKYSQLGITGGKKQIIKSTCNSN